MVTALAPCVSSALDEAADCLAAGRVGVFTADRMTCKFGEADATLLFSEPVGRGSQGFQLDFDLRVGDRLCLRYSEIDAEAPYVKRYELVTASHSVVYLQGFERQLECDGERHDYTADDLPVCSSAAMLELPIPKVTELADAVAFDFARSDHISRVFVCNPP